MVGTRSSEAAVAQVSRGTNVITPSASQRSSGAVTDRRRDYRRGHRESGLDRNFQTEPEAGSRG